VRVADTPRDTLDLYLEALDLEAAVRRDEQLTPAERAAVGQALAELHGLPWRPEWVVKA
jgi:hypothetical protein